MSALVIDLVQKRWVTKRYSVEDCRAVYLRLSRRGLVITRKIEIQVRRVSTGEAANKDLTAAGLTRLHLMTRRWSLVGLLALLTSSPAVAASEYQSKVVRVLDGDTIEMLHNQHPERIRLRGVDCPEKGHVYGNRAEARRADLAFKHLSSHLRQERLKGAM